MITPQTQIELLQTVLTADQENQLTFASVEAQNEYFEGLPRLAVPNNTYQRKDQTIRFEGNADSLIKYNYVRYKNEQFGNKWFYAFITSIDYINENVTAIHIKTDVYQTWCFDITLEPSFIEREHVADDSFGLHTLPEGLETGPFIVKEYIPMDWADLNRSLICMQVSDFPTSAGITTSPTRIYNGMPSGCYYLVFTRNNAAELNKWITAYVSDQKQDAILSIFPIPSALAQPEDPTQPSQIAKLSNSISSETYIFIQSDQAIRMTGYQIPSSLGNDFEGYVPKNNKLYVSPYCYFYLNTFTGSTVEYNYEQFSGPITFQVYGSITSGGEFKITPLNIRGAGDSGSYGYGMSLSAMPQGSWNSDTYLNWRALNADAIAIEAERDSMVSFLQSGRNAWNLDLLGVTANEIDYSARVKQRLNEQRIASRMPNQSRGDTASQSLNFSMGYADGGFYRMSIRKEYAQIIDQYFTAFGYLVNEFKTPNLFSRHYFNYIKTVGMNLEGDLPQTDLLELKQIFDRGCTFWHDPAYFLNYNVNNSII